jgi:hypothetical protein
MTRIDTWEQLAKALASPLPRPAKAVLSATCDRLEEFRDQPLGELCVILILQPPDTLAALEQALGFPFEPTQAEYIDHHDGWFELVFVTSDDGNGFVVLLEDHPDTDQTLLAACRAHQTN